MHDILARARQKAEHAEVYHLQRKIVPVEFDAEGLSVIKTRQSEGVALRTLCDGRLGYATSTNLAHPDEVVDAAVATARFGDATDLDLPTGDVAPLAAVDSQSLANLPIEFLIELGEQIQAAILEHSDDVEVGLTVQAITDHIRVANTAGLDVQERVTGLGIHLEVTRARADDIFTVGDDLMVRSISDISVPAATERIRWLLDNGRNLVPAPSGTLPVVFTAGGAVAVLLPLAIGLSGKAALLGTSPLRDKIGQTIFDARFSVSDDGSLAQGARAGAFDDEGVPAVRTPLAEDGVLKGFYYDLRTAKQANTQSTGNGIKGGFIGGRDFRPAPGPTISHISISPGDTPFDELVRSIDRGLVVDNVLGLGQGNVMAGDFSNNVSAAFLVEDGRIVGRVKNVMIAGNSYELLKDHLIGLSDDCKWAYGRINSPAIALGNVNVAAK